MKWTKTKPTKPGYYWNRDTSGIASVSWVGSDGEKLWAYVLLDRPPWDVSKMVNSEWSGPLEEPEE